MTAYDEDFAQWLNEQATALRARRFDQLDIDNLAEEVESAARAEKRRVCASLERVLANMLRWERLPNRRQPHWRFVMLRRRSRVRSLLDDSPSLWPRLPEMIEDAYGIARLTAMRQTGLPKAAFD
jgi:hypothetical protein